MQANDIIDPETDQIIWVMNIPASTGIVNGAGDVWIGDAFYDKVVRIKPTS